jgi:hypothetical protein
MQHVRQRCKALLFLSMLSILENAQSQPLSSNLHADFPYGSAPQGDVCMSSDGYATPESMLGSWAMIEALEMDSQQGALSSLFTPENTVYAVGTAALGEQLGLLNCAGGCNVLNGYCFAIKFNDKVTYPYMIFQSVNIAANPNTFDIYLAGGGSGAFPNSCKQFWGTDAGIDWGRNIENAASPSCQTYFQHFSTIKSSYHVTYHDVVHTAKETLMNACAFASAEQTGFNTKNWENLSVIPVTCPASLTQITGIALPKTVTTIGSKTLYDVSKFKEAYFAESTILNVTTTQMQDCKTPSSGYCGNVAQSEPNYQASISANLDGPLLTSQSSSSPDHNFCMNNPSFSGGFCSWNHGQFGGSDYCNQSQSICLSCGNASEWCVCEHGELVNCSNQQALSCASPWWLRHAAIF